MIEDIRCSAFCDTINFNGCTIHKLSKKNSDLEEGKKGMLVGDRNKRLVKGCLLVVRRLGGWRQLGGKWWWVAVVARLWFTPVVVRVLQRWSGLGDRWRLGGMLRRLWEEANKVLSFHGKLYLCKERTKLINSVRCPLDEKIGSNQGQLADSWTIFPPKRVCLFFLTRFVA